MVCSNTCSLNFSLDFIPISNINLAIAKVMHELGLVGAQLVVLNLLNTTYFTLKLLEDSRTFFVHCLTYPVVISFATLLMEGTSSDSSVLLLPK